MNPYFLKELFEFQFKLVIMFHQILNGQVQIRFKLGPSGKTSQRSVYPFFSGIIAQPIAPNHIRQHVLASGRNKVPMIFQKRILFSSEVFQRILRIITEVNGQKMIVIHVYNHPGIVPVLFAKLIFALAHNGVVVGVVVYFPMKDYAFGYHFRKAIELATLYKVAHEIAYCYFIMITGEI